MDKLQVLPVKKHQTTTNKKLDDIPPPLLRPEFLLIVVGPVRSGKGNLLVNILENKNFGYRQYFEDIIYISPTIENDVTGRFIKADEKIQKISDQSLRTLT
jgi:type II secretory ATPase GspE/PulE/Tfp pilus assembly ATPase PilB-like protein